MKQNCKIVLPGGAGLVGQNLIARLLSRGYNDLVVIDKHKPNIEVLKSTFPSVTAIRADLAVPGEWEQYFEGADAVVMLQAQIGGIDYSEFASNNVTSTELILEQVRDKQIPRLVHISSSVVESVADDFYTRSKTEQEQIVLDSGIECPILRPTLMFGWFDRKHLGWLSRFMKKVPVFPVPGHGRYMRQPLYVGDFCEVIISCIENRDINGIYNISGHEKVDYIDIIREIRRATDCRTPIVKIPYWLFYSLLRTWALFDKNPPFTTQQLAALIAKDEFEVTDWPGHFGVRRTPFREAIHETFNDPKYSNVTLEF
jgi:nucleoside-diphosphate-sugar epimerase